MENDWMSYLCPACKRMVDSFIDKICNVEIEEDDRYGDNERNGSED